MFFGIKTGKLHTARRVQLVIWLQILQEWIGIAGITIYGPEIFTIAGIAAKDRQWISGLNNITYMFSTLICVFTLDKIGRRWTLYWGAAGQMIACFCAGGLSYATEHATGSNKAHVGGGAVFFVFLYTAIFGATWLTVPWLYPAEIFPLQVRARGNAWGVVGWSIGNGWCVSGKASAQYYSPCTTNSSLGSALTNNLRQASRENTLHIRRRKCSVYRRCLGSLSRNQSTYARRDEYRIRLPKHLELEGREILR